MIKKFKAQEQKFVYEKLFFGSASFAYLFVLILSSCSKFNFNFDPATLHADRVSKQLSTSGKWLELFLLLL